MHVFPIGINNKWKRKKNLIIIWTLYADLPYASTSLRLSVYTDAPLGIESMCDFKRMSLYVKIAAPIYIYICMHV